MNRLILPRLFPFSANKDESMSEEPTGATGATGPAGAAGEVAMVRLRKSGGEPTAGVSWGGDSYLPDADGIIMVPHMAVGDLASHGFEPVPEGPGAIDQALDDLSAGVAAEGERVEALKEEALADVPPEAVAEARAEVQAESEAQHTEQAEGASNDQIHDAQSPAHPRRSPPPRGGR